MKIMSVDGGATKTVAALYDSNEDKITSIGISGPSNYFSVPHEESQNNIVSAISSAYHNWKQDDIKFIVGIAGFGDSKKANEIGKSIMDRIFSNKPYILENDGICAYRMAHLFDDGGIFAPGTGSIAIYQHNNEINRLGGWGWFAGDEGSASWIGKRSITMAEEQYDGIIEGSSLIELLESYFHNDFIELINKFETAHPKREIAMLAPHISKLALEGDKASNVVINEAAGYDAKILHVLDNKLVNKSMALIGGTTGSDILIKNVKKYYNSKLKFYHGYDVCTGGLLIAADRNNIRIDKNFRDKLVSNVEELIKMVNPEDLKKYLGII
ncbi:MULTISPECIES: BadF/BadG/BcrA/BcrD ATPase family protein [Ferroplasma]|jgi:N-acetylglucosamine kinase|uniref:ATPase BadF/BadG/BcrA/BcrD type domain-containing protein n=4 Tax=Ferroplasma acidiphilum TaxID=74969 RepID=A0A1V0N5N7_9ARCH|nr:MULTISPECIES: BadF/BadG/BcrA/BcrD ATPase family protein [Ferroplasma]ARD85421.1 hypothetical protein FAD_1574 [Ferroplasma acidiphilum]